MKRLLITILSSLALTSSALGDAQPSFSNYLELRTYVMHPGQRDAFLDHFETYYLESQEGHGMHVWGQFQDIENHNQFVWVRGFRSMEERANGLLGFYTSQMWESTSAVALEMMAERATHIHFLEAVDKEGGLPETAGRTGPGRPADLGIVVVQLYEIEGDGAKTIDTIRQGYNPVIEANEGESLGLFRSSREVNNFPVLPVIEGENVIAWFVSFPDIDHYDAAQSQLEGNLSRVEIQLLKPGEFSRLIHRPAGQ